MKEEFQKKGCGVGVYLCALERGRLRLCRGDKAERLNNTHFTGSQATKHGLPRRVHAAAVIRRHSAFLIREAPKESRKAAPRLASFHLQHLRMALKDQEGRSGAGSQLNKTGQVQDPTTTGRFLVILTQKSPSK